MAQAEGYGSRQAEGVVIRGDQTVGRFPQEKAMSRKEEVEISQAKMQFLLWAIKVTAILAILTHVIWMATVESRFSDLEDRVEQLEMTNLLEAFP